MASCSESPGATEAEGIDRSAVGYWATLPVCGVCAHVGGMDIATDVVRPPSARRGWPLVKPN
jgi:hypothetical protein